MDYDRPGGVAAKLLVSVRIRPLAAKDIIKDNIQTTARAIDDYSVCITEPTPAEGTDDFLQRTKERPKGRIYTFDQVFGETASQEEVFTRTVKGLIDGVVAGFNATVFAYGATGAGKTYTMLGTDTSPGIISLTLQQLFTVLAPPTTPPPQPTPTKTYTVTLTYLEIYNENIRDLLSGKSDYLDLREDAGRGVVVAGITSVNARSPDEVLAFLRKGNRYRTQEATGANEVSSRSHAVLQVLVGCTTIEKKGNRTERFGKLSMIDLAGSERAAETKNRGMRMIEGANINRSLLALGNCITALAEPSKRGKYVNYRDSKLTRLLKDSLGGNCRTAMIANISPASSNFDETLNTLKYATRARTIKTRVTQQAAQSSPYNATIQLLHSEIGMLKDRLVRAESTLALPTSRRNSLSVRGQLLVPPGQQQLQRRPSTKGSSLSLVYATTPPEQSMFTEMREMLQGLFLNQRELLVRTPGDAEEEAETNRRLEGIDEEIRNIRSSIPRSLDKRSREYLELMIQAHFTYLENHDLRMLHAAHTQRTQHSHLSAVRSGLSTLQHSGTVIPPSLIAALLPNDDEDHAAANNIDALDRRVHILEHRVEARRAMGYTEENNEGFVVTPRRDSGPRTSKVKQQQQQQLTLPVITKTRPSVVAVPTRRAPAALRTNNTRSTSTSTTPRLPITATTSTSSVSTATSPAPRATALTRLKRVYAPVIPLKHRPR